MGLWLLTLPEALCVEGLHQLPLLQGPPVCRRASVWGTTVHPQPPRPAPQEEPPPGAGHQQPWPKPCQQLPHGRGHPTGPWPHGLGGQCLWGGQQQQAGQHPWAGGGPRGCRGAQQVVTRGQPALPGQLPLQPQPQAQA